MKSEDKNQQPGLNDVAGNVTVGANNPASLANSATQGETPGMTPGPASGPSGSPTPPAGANPPNPQSPASSQSLAAAQISVAKDAVEGAGEKQENQEANPANPADLTSGAPARRGRKPGTPNKPKDGAPQAATARPADAKAGGRPRKVTPEASSDTAGHQPTTYGGNFGNDVQNSFQDQSRYQNQVSGTGRGEFGAQDYQGGTHGGYGNQYREFDFENRNSAEDRYYGGPGRYGPQHNAYRDYDGRDERGGQPSYRGGNPGYGDQGYNQGRRGGNYGYQDNQGGSGNYGNQGRYDDHGYDRHGFNQQGGHFYGPNEGYDPRHAGGYGYSERDRRPAGRDPREQGGYYDDRNAGGYGAGRGNYPNGDTRYQQPPRGYDDGRGNRQDNRNQPDRDDRRSGFQNDNGAGPGRPGLGYANDYGQSSIGGGDYGYGRGREQRPDQNYQGGYGNERRNQDEDSRSSRGGYDNQGSGGGRAGHQGDQSRYGQQGYQGGYGSGADEPRNRPPQGGPAQNQGADPRRQPTEGYGYGHGRDEQPRRPNYNTGDQRSGYGGSGFMGDSNQGYGSRGGSYDDEYDNANGGPGNPGGAPGSPSQGSYTQQERNRNYGPAARQQFRADKPEGEQDDYGSAPRRNRGRDGEGQE